MTRGSNWSLLTLKTNQKSREGCFCPTNNLTKLFGTLGKKNPPDAPARSLPPRIFVHVDPVKLAHFERKGSSSNQQFSGAMLVSSRVSPQYFPMVNLHIYVGKPRNRVCSSGVTGFAPWKVSQKERTVYQTIRTSGARALKLSSGVYSMMRKGEKMVGETCCGT